MIHYSHSMKDPDTLVYHLMPTKYVINIAVKTDFRVGFSLKVIVNVLLKDVAQLSVLFNIYLILIFLSLNSL